MHQEIMQHNRLVNLDEIGTMRKTCRSFSGSGIRFQLWHKPVVTLWLLLHNCILAVIEIPKFVKSLNLIDKKHKVEGWKKKHCSVSEEH